MNLGFPITGSSTMLQARRDGSTQDEPFAWDSREFLRRKAIGQVRNSWAYLCEDFQAAMQHTACAQW